MSSLLKDAVENYFEYENRYYFKTRIREYFATISV